MQVGNKNELTPRVMPDIFGITTLFKDNKRFRTIRNTHNSNQLFFSPIFSPSQKWTVGHLLGYWTYLLMWHILVAEQLSYLVCHSLWYCTDKIWKAAKFQGLAFQKKMVHAGATGISEATKQLHCRDNNRSNLRKGHFQKIWHWKTGDWAVRESVTLKKFSFIFCHNRRQIKLFVLWTIYPFNWAFWQCRITSRFICWRKKSCGDVTHMWRHVSSSRPARWFSVRCRRNRRRRSQWGWRAWPGSRRSWTRWDRTLTPSPCTRALWRWTGGQRIPNAAGGRWL